MTSLIPPSADRSATAIDTTDAPVPKKSSALPAIAKLVPGVAAAAAVAVVATFAEPWVRGVFPLPAMVIALLIGVTFNGLVKGEEFQAGLIFCVKKLLRWAVALLGLRIALHDIIDLGLTTAVLIVVAMALTIVA